MDREAALARYDVRVAEESLRVAKAKVDRIEAACKHRWSETRYTPLVTPGYHGPDLYGPLRGSDTREVWHPRVETPQWTRDCLNCGRTEVTDRSETQVTQTRIPQF